ncbi:MAG: hypothetical protein M4579_007466 [Chaenotheca gracillima]|nr:MAG: hypothetical protein M4579_007466 [Chaenotheca gracillima]
MGQMSLARDPQAPKTLTIEQSASINDHVDVKKLQQRASQSYQRLKSTYGGVQKAEGTLAFWRHQKLLQTLRSEKQRQRETIKKETREAFYNEIHTKEIEQQLYRPDTPKVHLISTACAMLRSEQGAETRSQGILMFTG